MSYLQGGIMTRGLKPGAICKVLTFEERKSIEKYLFEGFTYSDIARKIDRSKTGVTREINRNGGKAQYSAKKAQERQNSSNEEKNIKIKEFAKKNPEKAQPGIRFQRFKMELEEVKASIEGLKTAIELLTQIIKENV